MRPSRSSFPISTICIEFSEWSPWQLRDPKLAVSYGGPERARARRCSGPASAVGRQRQHGDHRQRAEPAYRSRREFERLGGPSSYDIAPSGSGSKVTWAFGYDSGSSPLKRWKALMLDGFVGSEYRAGLDRLKEKIEAERRPTAPIQRDAAGWVSTEPEQPSAALPPGAVPPPVRPWRLARPAPPPAAPRPRPRSRLTRPRRQRPKSRQRRHRSRRRRRSGIHKAKGGD